jgi:hypothetical protein
MVYRAQIQKLLAGLSLRRVKAGPVDFEFDRVLARAEAGLSIEPPADQLTLRKRTPDSSKDIADLDEQATTAPGLAVLQAHALLEQRLRNILASTEGGEPTGGAVALARRALSLGMITPETENAIEGVTVLRNLAAHGRADEVTSERAKDYLSLVDAILYSLRPTPAKPGMP